MIKINALVSSFDNLCARHQWVPFAGILLAILVVSAF